MLVNGIEASPIIIDFIFGKSFKVLDNNKCIGHLQVINEATKLNMIMRICDKKKWDYSYWFSNVKTELQQRVSFCKKLNENDLLAAFKFSTGCEYQLINTITIEFSRHLELELIFGYYKYNVINVNEKVVTATVETYDENKLIKSLNKTFLRNRLEGFYNIIKNV